jgi:hypothetical protein
VSRRERLPFGRLHPVSSPASSGQPGTNATRSQFGTIFRRSGDRAGRGQYLQVIVATGGSAVTVPHTLGRVPQMLVLLDSGNNANAAFTWPISSRTNVQISITFPVAGTYLIWLN